MFESISFFHKDKTSLEEPIDIGNLVECMLFYGKIEVYANRTILTQLFNFFGIEGIIELLTEELLIINYSAYFTGIHTQKTNGIEYHNPIYGFINDTNIRNDIISICQQLTGKTGKGRRIANRILELVIHNEPENLILENVKNTVLNQELIQNFGKSIITDLIPETIKIENLEFKTAQTKSGIILETNLNFEEINKIYHKYIPESHSSITRSSILANILAAEYEIYFASSNLTEISSSNITANLIPKKLEFLVNNSTKSTQEIEKFSEYELNSKSIAEFVNAKKIDSAEVISLIKKSKKFKKWIAELDGEQDLIKEYYDEITKETWADKLPGKTSRWSFFTFLGLVADLTITGGLATVIGVGLGAADNFIVDKLIQGWKPNQFIRGEVKPLLEK